MIDNHDLRRDNDGARCRAETCGSGARPVGWADVMDMPRPGPGIDLWTVRMSVLF